MVTFTSVNSAELIMDSWDSELAGRMVLFGDGMDVSLTVEYGLTKCPSGTTGRDRANHMLIVLDRFLKLARSAIAIGILKKHDTPANWIRWAEGKGYSVSHLSPNAQIEALQLALQDCPDDCPSLRDSYRKQLEQWQKFFLTTSVVTTQKTNDLPDVDADHEQTSDKKEGKNQKRIKY
ncbi:MAG: hypothetical protein IPN42_10565 [Methylococcaceae bacterium]|nr:hypothetical protein [Methylococcaceae bacterium]